MNAERQKRLNDLTESDDADLSIFDLDELCQLQRERIDEMETLIMDSEATVRQCEEEASNTSITFTIYGKPATQGSKRAFVIYPKEGGRPRAVVTENDKHCEPWRQEVASAAMKVYDGPLITGPVRLTVKYTYPRGPTHFGTGRNAGKLKASAPKYKLTTPDLSKLTRAVEDALKGVIYQDDSRITERSDSKGWGERYETIVTVEALEPENPEGES